jgi:hypothetical protein
MDFLRRVFHRQPPPSITITHSDPVSRELPKNIAHAVKVREWAEAAIRQQEGRTGNIVEDLATGHYRGIPK